MFSSCKSFLDEQVYSLRTEGNMYTKYEDADMAVMGIYSILSGADGFRFPWQCLTTYGTDEAINYMGGVQNANYFRVSNYSLSASDAQVSALYALIYSAIMNCNEAYWQIDKMNMREDLKQRLQAEALFLRAFCYFNLVQLWGEVRLNVGMPNFNEIVSRNAVRSPVSEVYARIAEDIEFAKQYLPVKWDYRGKETDDYRGRATKYAAYGLAAKIYLTMASGSKYGVAGYEFDSNEYYRLAKGNADTVMVDGKGIGGHDLLSTYDDVFSYKNKYNREILFDMTFCIGGPGSAYAKMGGPLGQGSFPYYVGGWPGRGYLRPSLYLALNTYGHTLLIADGAGVISQFTSDDARFWFNIATYTLNGTTGLPQNNLRGDPAQWTAQKFSMRTVTLEGGYGWQFAPMNHPVLRYADVLLIYAEAAGMLNLNDASAYNAANLVRQRAKVPGRNPTYLADWNPGDFADTDQFMDAILAERMKELCFEGHRRFDLLRTSRLFRAIEDMKTAARNLETTHNKALADLVYASDIINQKYDVNVKPYHILFPIPQYEMNIVTNPNYKQNPGWMKATEYEE